MNTYTVRPYFGHDCNSWDGFNNGYYLEEMTVKADSEQDAIDKAMHLAIERGLAPMEACADTLGDATLYWETCYSDGEGNEVSKEQWLELNEDDSEVGGYLYQYLDFSDVQQVARGVAL
jgi:hypothetical protein